MSKVRSQENFGDQGFQVDVKELFEPITKADTDTDESYLSSGNQLQRQWKN